MKKIVRIFSIIFICIFILPACVMQKESDLNQEVNIEETAELAIGKEEALSQLSNLMEIIRDDTQEHDLRENATMDFLKVLQSALLTYDFSDQELSDLTLNVFECENQESLQNDISIRFIVFLGYPDIFGSLERIWTFAEIYQGNEKSIQMLYEKTPETPTNSKILQEDGRNYVLLYGGTTMYTPRPLFVSFWELLETELIPGELINRVDSSSCVDVSHMRCYENKLIFECGHDQWYFDEAMTDLTENPLLSVNLDSKFEIIISFEDGKFIAQTQ